MNLRDICYDGFVIVVGVSAAIFWIAMIGLFMEERGAPWLRNRYRRFRAYWNTYRGLSKEVKELRKELDELDVLRRMEV